MDNDTETLDEARGLAAGLQSRYAIDMRDMAGELADGSLTVEDFLARADEMVTAVNMEVAALACGEEVAAFRDYVNGQANPARADAADRVVKQLGCLKRLAPAIQAGEVDSLDRLVVLTGVVRNTFEEALRRHALASGAVYERRELGDTGCCEECASLAARGWEPVGTLPEVGDTGCLTDCDCVFSYSNVTPRFAVADLPHQHHGYLVVQCDGPGRLPGGQPRPDGQDVGLGEFGVRVPAAWAAGAPASLDGDAVCLSGVDVGERHPVGDPPHGDPVDPQVGRDGGHRVARSYPFQDGRHVGFLDLGMPRPCPIFVAPQFGSNFRLPPGRQDGPAGKVGGIAADVQRQPLLEMRVQEDLLSPVQKAGVERLLKDNPLEGCFAVLVPGSLQPWAVVDATPQKAAVQAPAAADVAGAADAGAAARGVANRVNSADFHVLIVPAGCRVFHPDSTWPFAAEPPPDHHHVTEPGPAVFDRTDPLSGIVVTFGGRPMSLMALEDYLKGLGLSGAAVEAVASHCDIAEDAANDRLLAAACMANSMRVQSLLFPKDEYDEKAVHRWCDDHDYKHSKIDTTENFHRVRQFDPGDCKGEPRTIPFKKAKGVKAVICPMPAAEHSSTTRCDPPPFPVIQAPESVTPEAPGEAVEPLEMVWFDGKVWDTESVFWELMAAGMDEWAATGALGEFERVKFEEGKKQLPSDAKTDDASGRPFIWRRLSGHTVKIFVDDEVPHVEVPSHQGVKPDDPIHAIVGKINGAHSGPIQAAKNTSHSDEPDIRAAKIAKAVVVAHARAKDEHEKEQRSAQEQKKGLARRIAGKVAEVAKNVGEEARGAVKGAALKARRKGKQYAGATAHEVREKGLVGSASSATRKTAEGAKRLGKKVVESDLARKAVGKSAALQALGDAARRTAAISRRGRPVREPGESTEKYQKRSEEWAKQVAPKLQAFKAARITSYRAELKGSWAPKVKQRLAVFTNDLKDVLQKYLPKKSEKEEETEEAAQKNRGLVAREWHNLKNLPGAMLRAYGAVYVMQANSGKDMLRRLKTQYPGAKGATMVKVAKYLNATRTVAGAAGMLGLAVGPAALLIVHGGGAAAAVGALGLGALGAVQVAKAASYARGGAYRMYGTACFVEAATASLGLAGRGGMAVARGLHARAQARGGMAGQDAKAIAAGVKAGASAVGRGAGAAASAAGRAAGSLGSWLKSLATKQQFADDLDAVLAEGWWAEFAEEGEEDDGGPVKPEDLPDDFDWGTASKIATEVVNEHLQKYADWLEANAENLEGPFSVLNKLDLDEEPVKDMVESLPKEAVFSDGEEDVERDAAARAEFLKSVPVPPEAVEAARAEILDILDVIDATYGSRAARLALAGAVTAPLACGHPVTAAPLAAAASLLGSYEGVGADGAEEYLSPGEAVEAGRSAVELFTAGWLEDGP